MLKPNKLKIGDKIAIVSLSSGIAGESFVKHQIDLGVKRLKEMGLNPVFMNNSLKGLDFIKNNPDKRAEDLKEAFLDDSIKGIICVIGGDDTFKTIPYLLGDNEFVNKVKTNPKIFVGFSDTTNNHFMFQKIGMVTYYGLNFLSDIAELDKEMLPYSKKSFKLLFENHQEILIESSEYWYKERVDFSKNQLNIPRKRYKEEVGHEYLNGDGVILGKLTGGCIESIYSMLTGDRYFEQKEITEKYKLIPNKEFFKESILFLETSEEKPTVEKFTLMIDVLIEKNIINNVKALVFGKPQDNYLYNEYKEILLKKVKVPILYNVNVGHALPRMIIPYGILAEIDFNKKTFKIKEKMFKD